MVDIELSALRGLSGAAETPKVDSPHPAPKKKVLYDQAIFTTLGIGINQFLYSLLDAHDFATSCLQFTGFFVMSLGYKLWQIS